ncbi:tetratricopeptide repeat protein [Actinoplanes sp. Pm04-4]|uniref:Tetratricopeptide repeat protein n=1 Tax=Paractinoplanes pyxinae TaxID=2997416 RepID=A0ABT4B1V3_9ACTN|nr:tetratricopeptide repeat protein [Actinoplanes pyxinae]MCY1139635.1 tetratricopeptide repeat protein [Actinoplanes pyxinae]
MAHPVRRRVTRALLVAGLLLVAGATPAAAAPAPSPGPAATVVVPLPAGATLPPGRYQVTLRGGGRQITTTGSVLPAAPSAAPSPPAEPDSGPGAWIGLGGAVLLAGIGAGLYLATRGPRSRRREFERLAGQVEAGEYQAAVGGLTRLESQLPPALRAEARFLCGFALYQLGDLDEAEHRLAALNREDPESSEVAYLLAYLRVQRRDFERAQPVLAALDRRGRLDVGQARRLYGVVQYQLAGRAASEGRIDDAVTLFRDVERLGDFRDRVPADLRSKQIVLGTRALLDRDPATARRHFEELRDAGGDDDQQASAALGLGLTVWAENKPGAGKKVHQLLSRCLRLLDPDGPATRRWPGPPSETVADEISRVRRAGEAPAADRERARLLADIHLLRGCALVRAFAEETPLLGSERQLLGGTAERLAYALTDVRQLADPYLVVGLLRHHLARDASERRTAIAELQAAQALGARDPLLLEILHRHERQTQRRRAVWSGHAGRYGRTPTVDDVTSAAPVGPVSAPTVAELSERAELLAARLHAMGADLGDSGAAATALAARLEQESAELTRRARAVEATEAELLALIGGRLLAGDFDEDGSGT